MRAVVVSDFGGPNQLRLIEVADPVPGPGQVRVRVMAAGVNPVDAGNRSDGSWAGLRVPCILGYDVSGVVDALGPGVSEPGVGERVMAMTHFPDSAGGYAELVAMDAGLAAPIAVETSFTHAAATPLAAGTAELVLGRLALPPGSRMLVLGGSGGVGLFLLQMAARLGIEAIGVGRPAMHEKMQGLGAAACVDYTAGDVARRARELADGPVDAIADLVGGPHLEAAFDALRPGGQIASIATPDLELDPLLDSNITFHGILIGDDGARTRRLAARLADGSLRAVVSHELPLAEAAQAHEILEQGHSGGKIVLRLGS
jgi:NADPH2:quinone reductase